MKNNGLFITSADKKVYFYDFKAQKLCTILNNLASYSFNLFFGITRLNDYIYLSTNRHVGRAKFNLKYKVLTLEKMFEDTSKIDPHYHHLKAIDDMIFVPATYINTVFVLNKDLNHTGTLTLAPPDNTKKAVYRTNYNHVNGIHKYKDKYYIDINWLTNKQFSMSGVVVLNQLFEEIDRFEYGWQSHGFCIIDDLKYVLCGYSLLHKNVLHPKMSGVMVEGDIVYRFDDKWFCKNFSVDDDYIYIIGGNTSKRADRHRSNGIIIILDRQFKKVDELVFENTGEFLGCLLDQFDLTDI